MRISFLAVFRMICDEGLRCAIAAPGAIPRHLRNLSAGTQHQRASKRPPFVEAESRSKASSEQS